mmetsp:Transcript_1563/g.3336  ORF Transcript_1563/g.3336 Transcript_1563/m.3336 type:complete len:342 (-) Transcript_1563:838-1863(-)
MPPKLLLKKPALFLESESEEEFGVNSMSCEIGPEGLFYAEEGLKLGRDGISRESHTNTPILSLKDIDIVRKIGSGASAIVSLAVHRPTGMQLAVKSINAYDKEKRRQLMNDIHALENAECPFLVKFYGAYYEEGLIRVALELMDCGSLADIIEKSPVLPEPILARIAQQIIGGLMYLHRVKRQVHRDIKPENVLVNSAGAVKLSDFGISKELSASQELCKTFVGTRNYMSPERISGKKYSYSGDIWSLGLMLIQMAMGRFPYPDCHSVIDLLDAMVQIPEPTLPDTFSSEFQDFIRRCVKLEPNERWTAVSLAAHPWVLSSQWRNVDLAGWIRRTKRTRAY